VNKTIQAFCLTAFTFQSAPFDAARAQDNRPAKEDKAKQNDAASPAAIKKIIQQLGSADFAEREMATKRLEAIGKPALPALREAAKNNEDAEIQRRAQRLVKRLAPEPDPLEELLKEATLFEQKKDYKKVAEILDKLFDKAKDLYSPGPNAPVTDIPFLTEVALRTARARKQLGEYEKAAKAFHLAEYYSNSNRGKRMRIDTEWSIMITELLANWDGIVQKSINDDAALKLLANKYPLVLLHTRRFAGGHYHQSTYSFVYETADEAKHFNDVQLQFDNGAGKNTFGINMVVGQKNRVADLGKVDFAKDPDPAKIGIAGKPQWSSEECKATEGHVYLEEIKDDRGNHFYVVFQIVATDKDSRFLAFIWRKLPGGTVVSRP
jgi:hypothetical protein